jgi:hypothetical protein
VGAEWPVLSLSFMVCRRQKRLVDPYAGNAELWASASIGIGVRNPKVCQYLCFEALHFESFFVSQVIIAQNMEKSMHHKVTEVICERNALFNRFPFQRFARKGNVAQNA